MSSGACAFTPDGRLLLVPVQGSELLLHSAQDGTLLQRLQAECGEPVQALAFDHNGTTLWLAGEKTLVQYQTQSQKWVEELRPISSSLVSYTWWKIPKSSLFLSLHLPAHLIREG